jgi:hypothetical protein
MDDTDGAALVCWRQRQHREKRMEEEEEERGLEIHRCTTSLLGERDKMIIGY